MVRLLCQAGGIQLVGYATHSRVFNPGFLHARSRAVCAGEFDAFQTIMAILRMRKKYPHLKPHEYYDNDEDFRNFVNCKPCK